MRFYDIALFMFAFNLMLGFLPHMLTSFDVSYTSLDNFTATDIESGVNQITSDVDTVYIPIWSELNYALESVKLVISGLHVFLATFINATILFPIMWKSLGAGIFGNNNTVFESFVNILSGLLYFVYFAGIVQYATGRSNKDVQ